ncbi:wd g-beta repeat-containing protein [Cyclospora cayetanensis]|uniref:Wd g-beta repeat-containing protein n=1 Tax=Cyclospora cayetanensis TaxID=88456 RepID=A0A1D3CUA4_9EIME|nr:wd g-beta repeat-containing protein [Cyclospora cayetanensis]
MSAFSSFCVPEVEGCGPVRRGRGDMKLLPVIEQVGILDLSEHLPTRGRCASANVQPPCLQHIVGSGLSTDVCCIDAASTLALIDANTLQCTCTVAGAHTAPVTSCSFLHHNSYVLVTCAQDGAVKLWDFREKLGGKADPFTATATVQIAPAGSREADMWALAVRGDDQVIAASFKSFVKGYDLRAVCTDAARGATDASARGRPRSKKGGRRLLWDLQVHGDYVMALQFHPLYPNLLVSGGEDSLVCVSDAASSLSSSEDTALVACFSQERAVKGLSILGPAASCICIRSAMEDVGLWQVNGLDTYCSSGAVDGVSVQRRAEWLSVRSHPQIREGDSSGYVVDVFYDQILGRLFILAGSVSGQLVLLHANLDGIEQAATFKQKGLSQGRQSAPAGSGALQAGGHTGVVRGAINVMGAAGSGLGLLTCGEDGRVCAWRQRGTTMDGDPAASKVASRQTAGASPY